MVDDVRVRRAAAHALHARIVHRRIPIHREQLPAGLVVREIALVAHHAALVVHAAVLDAEHADVAFAVERNVARVQRILRVGADAIERAVQVARHLARDLAVVHVGLESVQARRPTHLGRNGGARRRADLATFRRLRLRVRASKLDAGGDADGARRRRNDDRFRFSGRSLRNLHRRCWSSASGSKIGFTILPAPLLCCRPRDRISRHWIGVMERRQERGRVHLERV